VGRRRRLTVPRRGARPRHGRFSRYAAPLAFLTAVTIAVLLVSSALKSDDTPGTKSATTVATAKRKTTTKPAKKKQRAARYYVVVAGDTFEVIAGKTGTSVAALERLNPGVSSTSLYVGQKLRVG